MIIIKKKNEYQKIFDGTTNKEQFIKVMLKAFPKLKLITINRRYYDFKHYFPHNNNIHNISYEFSKDELQEPAAFKMLIIKDAKRLKYKVTLKFLEQEGFNKKEMNWLLMKGEIENDGRKF